MSQEDRRRGKNAQRFPPSQQISQILVNSLDPAGQTKHSYSLTNGHRHNFKTTFQVGMIYDIYLRAVYILLTTLKGS